MPKNPNHRSKPVKKDEPLTGAMKFFIAGCLAELYLLIVRRCYVGGVAQAQINWYDMYLPALICTGAVILVIGAVLSYLWKSDAKKRIIAWYITGGGAFLCLASLLIHRMNAPAVTFLSVVVPVIMLLGILWNLYDRECAISLTILGVSLLALWAFRREMNSIFYGTAAKILAVVYLILLAAIVLLARKVEAGNGKVNAFRLLPGNADYLPIYAACGLSALGVVAALISKSIAYYAMWGLAIVVFALFVYYTVKQL